MNGSLHADGFLLYDMVLMTSVWLINMTSDVLNLVIVKSIIPTNPRLNNVHKMFSYLSSNSVALLNKVLKGNFILLIRIQQAGQDAVPFSSVAWCLVCGDVDHAYRLYLCTTLGLVYILHTSGWDLAVCGWDLAELWMRSSRRLAANAVVATVLDSTPASSDTVESAGRQMKQCWISYIKKSKKSPFYTS